MGTEDEQKSLKKAQEAAENLIRHIKTVEPPETLKEYRRLFKKTIPWNLRTWVGSYLFKEYIQKNSRSPRKSFNDSPGRKSAGTTGTRGNTLHINIGKNRRIFPKDITQILVESGDLKNEDVVDIRIFPKYSFITLVPSSVEKAIKTLQGAEFRGFKINVSLAKPRNSK